MEHRTFTVRQSLLMKTLLYGHIANIILGVLIFSTCHILLQIPTIQSVGATIMSTLCMSIVVSYLGTRKLEKPLSALSSELANLHEKINHSNTALTKVSQSSSAFEDSLPVGFIVFNSKMEFIRGNKNALTLLSLTEQPKVDAALILDQIKHLRSNGSDINFIDWLHQAKSDKIQALKRWPFVKVTSGEEDQAMFDIVARYNKNDSYGNELVLLFIDRTEEYARQEKQMEFISLAAHELRGPITVMRGLTDILEDEVGPSLSQEHKQLVTRILVSARQLAGYVDNILGVSRIDRDTFEVHLQESQWKNVVAQSIPDLAARAAAHRRILEINIPEGLPTVAADSSAILHVINNLVDNGIKYSPENGKVIVSSVLKEDSVETTIQDFGIGIPANVVNNLFTKFYRSHRSKQIVSGTGLGLFLCKAIVEAHGGSIWVRSSEGSGTTFGFTLPTYASVAEKIKDGTVSEEGIIRSNHGWIKNHALYRR
jgi:signal transduction histidine kinase